MAPSDVRDAGLAQDDWRLRLDACVQPPKPVGKPISAVIRDLRSRSSTAAMDEEFARDIEAGIEAHRQPWTPRF